MLRRICPKFALSVGTLCISPRLAEQSEKLVVGQSSSLPLREISQSDRSK
jgi:hypothetical protein